MHLRSHPLAHPLAVVCVVALATAADTAGAQETVGRARVAGVVTDATSRQPIAGVTVRIVGTSFAAITGADGRYVIGNARPGLFNIEARRIGYGIGRVDNVRLVSDSVVVQDFRLNDNPLRLESVVVSGGVDETQGVKTPFTVAKLTAEDLPVPPNTSAAGLIQGKVAGVQVIRGRGPGAGVNIQVRTPTSQFKANGPIYVVDGVVLNTQTAGITRDIESLDVASIEVIKGPSATSLYGSLGANGVVMITTNRGNNLALNTTQFSARAEAGANQFYRIPERPLYHHFRVNANGGWVNAAGRDTNRLGRTLDVVPFKDNPYVGPTYDPTRQFARAGGTQAINLQLQQNLASTNFAISYARQHDEGVIAMSNGWLRQNLRVNVDHRRGDKFNVGISAYHARATEDPTAISWGNFFQIDPDVNLDQRTPDGRYVVLPDSASTIVNPLYTQQVLDDRYNTRARTLLNGNAQYKLSRQFTARADINVDRSDQTAEAYTPRGVLGSDGQTPTLGYYERENDIVEGVNASAGITWADRFGKLSPRFTLQGLVRREKNPWSEATASDFSVGGVRSLAVGQTRTVNSAFTDRRLKAGIASLTLDYDDKLIGDFSVSREGNSLFGPESRWNNWYRASGAYRMAQEQWWPWESVNEFKLRYSYGEAGNRPSFYDQFETLELAAGGLPTRQSFGNRRLTPEISREQEYGLDAIIRNRVSVTLVYAQKENRNQIISMPLPALTGFNTQEQNTGRTRGRTLELELQAQVLQRGGLTWEMNGNMARSRSVMVEFGRSCYGEDIYWRCDGSNLDDMWGGRWITSTAELPAVHQGASLGAFQVNDDGYLVAVGQGNSWRDGIAKNLWGTTVNVDGRNYAWGRPILLRDSTGATALVKIGRALPDFSYGYGNTIRWRGFQLYGLFTGQVGGNIYNLTKRTLYSSNDHMDVVQAGKPDEAKKPIQYYSGADGLSALTYSSHFVENGTYAKLSELSLRYTLPQRLISRLGRLNPTRASVELVGRNLLTFTGYSGIDPEADTPLRRIDSSLYPMYRNWTAAVNLVY